MLVPVLNVLSYIPYIHVFFFFAARATLGGQRAGGPPALRRTISFTSLDLSSAFRTVFPLFGFGRFLPLHELFFLDSLTMAIHPNVARQFKPFGSANSCQQSIHSKAWYHRARSKKFTR